MEFYLIFIIFDDKKCYLSLPFRLTIYIFVYKIDLQLICIYGTTGMKYKRAYIDLGDWRQIMYLPNIYIIYRQ